MDWRRLCLCLVFACLLAACTGSGDNGSSTVPASDTLISGQTLPGTSYPHQIDFYVPAGANKSIVFLHGGLGTNYCMAYSLGINTVNAPPTDAGVNWSWLETNKVLAVFPQGQAIASAPLASTWSNHVMTSGQDDMAFLQSLVSYITNTYHITDIYLAGHSNGGMMANRVWCEDPRLFKAYIAMSGPASDYYFVPPPGTSPTPPLNVAASQMACNPTPLQPYFSIVGAQDSVLQVATYGFTNPTYAISSTLASSPAVLDPVLIGAWYQQSQVRAPLMCSDTTLNASMPTSSDGNTNTWLSCSGRLALKEVLNAEHSIDSLQVNSGYQMIDLIMEFINQLP